MKLSRRWIIILLVVLVGVVSAPYLTTALNTVSGRPVAPLDDAYITLQYARQIARGHLYQYNDKDPPTTGMTSPLFGFLLACVYLLGFTGERMVTFVIGTGMIWLGLTVWLTYRLTWRLTNRDTHNQKWAMAAAALVALTGSLQWACFNGMETGFFTVLTLTALDAFLARRMTLCALWLGLAGLTRPEGLILTGLIWAISLIEGFLCSRTVRWRHLALLSAAILVGFVPSIVNWTLTGTPAAAGLQAKSWWLNVPAYPEEIIRSILRSYHRIILGLFIGWKSTIRSFVPPGLFLLSVLGWIALGLRRQWSVLTLTVLWFIVGTLSTATLITATWHVGRYQAPFIPVTIVLAICGLAFFHERTTQRWQQALLRLALLFLLASSVSSIPRFADLYRRAVNTMLHQQLPIADWLRENLPADARIGVHDTGSLRYLGERPTYDLIGLTTPNATIPWRHGAGSVFELMEHSPMRPNYFAIYPDVFSIPYLAATDLFAKELLRVEVPDHAIASAGPVQGVWRADWRLASSGDQYYQPDTLARAAGLTLVDTLDIADLDDETAHSVEWWQNIRRPGFPTELQQLTYRVLPDREVLDGGRLLTGGIAFDVTTRPGESLWIVARLHAQEAGAVRVQVNDNDVGHWAYPPVPGQWLETVFQVPAETITDHQTHIKLQVDTDDPNFRHYAIYYFWFLQSEAKDTPIEIEYRPDITFDSQFSLLGFDLPEQMWRPGDVIPITLYWQADEPSQSDARVFLHLYDADGNLKSQSDGWAFRGTRPPYTWQTGEVVVDPRLLVIPMDLTTGPYSLEVGLYDPDKSKRLPAYRNGVRQHKERVPLTMIEITK